MSSWRFGLREREEDQASECVVKGTGIAANDVSVCGQGHDVSAAAPNKEGLAHDQVSVGAPGIEERGTGRVVSDRAAVEAYLGKGASGPVGRGARRGLRAGRANCEGQATSAFAMERPHEEAGVRGLRRELPPLGPFDLDARVWAANSVTVLFALRQGSLGRADDGKTSSEGNSPHRVGQSSSSVCQRQRRLESKMAEPSLDQTMLP